MAELLDLTDMRAVAEHIVAIGVERDRFRSALLEIADHLGAGPCGQTGCRGCEYEYGEAVRISREALGLPYARCTEPAPEEDDDLDLGGDIVGHCSKCDEARDAVYTCRDGGSTVALTHPAGGDSDG